MFLKHFQEYLYIVCAKNSCNPMVLVPGIVKGEVTFFETQCCQYYFAG